MYLAPPFVRIYRMLAGTPGLCTKLNVYDMSCHQCRTLAQTPSGTHGPCFVATSIFLSFHVCTLHCGDIWKLHLKVTS